MLSIDDIPQRVADDIHAFGVIILLLGGFLFGRADVGRTHFVRSAKGSIARLRAAAAREPMARRGKRRTAPIPTELPLDFERGHGGDRIGAVVNNDLNGRQSRDWDEVENENLSFFARSNENKEPKEAAMPRHAATIFSEVKRGGEKPKFTRLFVAAPRPNPLCSTKKNHRTRWFFLFKPQAWYGIIARSAVHIIKGGDTALASLPLRLDDIQYRVIIFHTS